MDMDRFDLPDEMIIDPLSGYSVNVPFEYQGYPFWWDDKPETVGRIKAMREKLGIIVEDFPSGVPVHRESEPIGMDDALSIMQKRKEQGR